jgi:hypothetical protein
MPKRPIVETVAIAAAPQAALIRRSICMLILPMIDSPHVAYQPTLAYHATIRHEMQGAGRT